MTRIPTGRLFPAGDGTDLVVTRTFRAPVEDVWASVTESERTARWFGPWEGDAGPGRTVKVQLVFEEEKPWMDLRIDACEPPVRLAVSSTDPGGWRMEVLLSETAGTTELRFVHHLDGVDQVGEIGPGWEYYLDVLVAARENTRLPLFDEYYPAMKPYFDALAGEMGD